MKKSPWAVFAGAVVVGLFMGISILTGLSVSPTNIINDIGNQVTNQTGNEAVIAAWHDYSFYFLLAGTIATIIEVVLIYMAGKVYIISALIGFLAGLMLVFSPVTGAFLLIGGAMFSWLFTRFWWRRKVSSGKK